MFVTHLAFFLDTMTGSKTDLFKFEDKQLNEL